MSNLHTWGSHIPTNKMLLELFPITGVLELGAGHHSTPMFFDSCDVVTSIENDGNWIDTVKEKITTSDKKKIIHHPLPSYIDRGTRRHQTKAVDLGNAVRFWERHIEPEMNLLFIDCYSSMRYQALTKLYDKFDVITFHDYQMTPGRPGIRNHYNGTGITPPEGYKMLIDKSMSNVYTGILIKQELYDDVGVEQMEATEQRILSEMEWTHSAHIVEV